MTSRRLEDLYVQGDFVTFDDGKGPITVWLQVLSPVHTAAAMRRANAARARVKTVKHDPDSIEYQDLWLEVLEWDTKDQLVGYLVVEQQMRIEARIEAELASEDEWAEDGYLQGLRDSWESGLSDAYVADPDSPEGTDAKRVLAELTRFAETAAERGAPELAVARAELETRDMQGLQEMALDRVIAYRASTAWMDEFHTCELFYGVHPAVQANTGTEVPGRDGKWVADASTRYWRKREDFDRVSGKVLQPLYARYAELSVDVVEGKDSEETPSSSDSSGAPSAPATGDSSGLVAADQ